MNNVKDLETPLVHSNSGLDSSVRHQHQYSLNSTNTLIKEEDKEESDNEERLDSSQNSDEQDEQDDQAEDERREQSFVEDHSEWRTVLVNDYESHDSAEVRYASNEIHTAKYTWLTFLPKNLFYQFTRIANIYFLVMMIFQMIPQITISQGMPTILMPLSFVVLVSMVKDIIEDAKRHSSDNRENKSKVL